MHSKQTAILLYLGKAEFLSFGVPYLCSKGTCGEVRPQARTLDLPDPGQLQLAFPHFCRDIRLLGKHREGIAHPEQL